MTAKSPSKVHLHQQSNTLELIYGGESYSLAAEFLRVHSTSAEVKGHGVGQEKLVDGKIGVSMNNIEAVGRYGLKIIYDDGHDTGIYTWTYLHDLCENTAHYWQKYLEKLEQEKKSRDPHTNVVQFPG